MTSSNGNYQKHDVSISSSSSSTMESHGWTSCQIFWSSQSGRAKSCSRRASRMIGEMTGATINGTASSFDDGLFTSAVSSSSKSTLLILFVSTTGDGEHCSSIQETWKQLLSKSLDRSSFADKSFALFCLGDRAYGPQFCAAGRKLAVRLMQLGMKSVCEVGYGDDNTPNGGVFRDMDVWFEQKLQPILYRSTSTAEMQSDSALCVPECLYSVSTLPETAQDDNAHAGTSDLEWQQKTYYDRYIDFFSQSCPTTGYVYESGYRRSNITNSTSASKQPLLGKLIVNNRMTSADWEQNTRDIRIQVNVTSKQNIEEECLPYDAGDVAVIMPSNDPVEVSKFLEVLPQDIACLADTPLDIRLDDTLSVGRDLPRWPCSCTLRGWLTYCADIHTLPDREDLRALSVYCSLDHELGKDQSEKLRSLCETSESALYADYILREKRTWVDVFFDFESLRAPGTQLTLSSLFQLLPPIRPREYSIASAPLAEYDVDKSEISGTTSLGSKNCFMVDLCVGSVEGTTRRGRKYHGLCSHFLSTAKPSQPVLFWIRPGSFAKLPLEVVKKESMISFTKPLICVGAGTGIAPMRSLIHHRIAVLEAEKQKASEDTGVALSPEVGTSNILVFGCRRKDFDFYYEEEWSALTKGDRLRLITAFSRDQFRKIYVQHVLQNSDDGQLIASHILDRNGSIYIAGAPRMAHAVKDVIVEALVEILGDKKRANSILSKMRQDGRFAIEAW